MYNKNLQHAQADTSSNNFRSLDKIGSGSTNFQSVSKFNQSGPIIENRFAMSANQKPHQMRRNSRNRRRPRAAKRHSMCNNQTTPNWPGAAEESRRVPLPQHGHSQQEEATGAAIDEDLLFNAAQSIWPYEEDGSIQQHRQSLPALEPATPTPFQMLLSEPLTRPEPTTKNMSVEISRAKAGLSVVAQGIPVEAPPRSSIIPHRFSFDAVGSSFRSERMAPYSAQLSPIAEIRNMISPQLNASRAPVDTTNPKLLFIALQEYFEKESRSVKAGGRPAN